MADERARITTIRLPSRLIELLDAAAREMMTTRSELIRRASVELLDRKAQRHDATPSN